MLDVPVGVIVTCWGGTPVEAWMDRETMSGFKEFDLSFLDNPDQIDRPQYKPCGLYNGMIAPLVPYTVKGFLWYQGAVSYTHLEIGSSRMPRSMCSAPPMGSHTAFQGISVGNTPAASRPAEKYSKAVQ